MIVGRKNLKDLEQADAEMPVVAVDEEYIAIIKHSKYLGVMLRGKIIYH